MKKKIFVAILAVICIIISNLSVANTEASELKKDNNNYIDEPYQYPVIPGTNEWKELDSMPQKIAVSHVKLELLEKMTTSALVETVVTYPLFICVHAYDSLETGVTEVSTYFKGIEELCKRSDAREKVLQYINDRCPGLAEMKTEEEIGASLSGYIKAYDESGDREVFYIDNAITLNDYIESLCGKEEKLRYTSTYVYTPLNTAVSAVYGYTIYDHTTPTNAQIRNSNFKTSFPNAVELSSINPAYNCHSYAWHQQSTSNNYWIDYPAVNAYMTDGSYSSSNPAIGRRVVYKNSNGAAGHSGVISAITGTTYVTSKWEYCGLFYHTLTDCPYYSSCPNISYWKLN